MSGATARLVLDEGIPTVIWYEVVAVVIVSLQHIAGDVSESRHFPGQAYRVGKVPHNPCTPVMTASCVQLDAAIHNVAIQEYTGNEFVPPKSDFVKEPLKLEDGHLIVPDTPGLGIELNEEAFKHYPPQPHVRPPIITSDGALRDY